MLKGEPPGPRRDGAPRPCASQPDLISKLTGTAHQVRGHRGPGGSAGRGRGAAKIGEQARGVGVGPELATTCLAQRHLLEQTHRRDIIVDTRVV